MKALNLTKKAGIVASLLLASSLVSANDYVLGDITYSTIDTDVQAPMADAFTDNFQFTLTEGNYFNALATSATASISEFSDISLENISGQTYDIAGIFSVAEWTEAATGQSTFLDSGSYILSISGTATANSTGYTLNTVTSPVPEPSSIALMLGGLGLVGFMAANRRKKQSV